jgi:chromosome segregation ATPase
MPGAGGPALPPMPPKAAPAIPLPPAGAAFQNQMGQAESAQSELQDKVAELEKKLMEEREKVLLAQLRSKEEEAVSAKVETSIKEIQDKLRREKKEQELEEMRKKAEGRVIQMERRLAEEREAWVSTLKGQLNQRDQITQEMETHFSTRLKDLEYRWAQEKSSLETAIRDRDAELIRVRQEFALKAEHDRAFWEDRVKSIVHDREKFERENERINVKFQQEKDQLLFERQNLRDTVSKLESALKFIEEQSRVEKNTLKREMDIEQQSLQKQMSTLLHQAEVYTKELMEKSAVLESQKSQLSQFHLQLTQLQATLQEKEKAVDFLRAQVKEEQAAKENLRRDVEHVQTTNRSQGRELEDVRQRLAQRDAVMDERVQDVRRAGEDRLRLAESKAASLQAKLDDAQKIILDHERVASTRRGEINKVHDEYESRIKMLQTRLDWYDSNVKREYRSIDKMRQLISRVLGILYKCLK